MTKNRVLTQEVRLNPKNGSHRWLEQHQFLFENRTPGVNVVNLYFGQKIRHFPKNGAKDHVHI
jgi:hypothetical protein